jgi:hypothetical protein
MTEQRLMVSEADWETAIQAGLTLGLILEQGLLSHEQKLASEGNSQPAYPLMYQAEVNHLRDIGPLLLDMSGQPFTQLMAIQDALGSENLCGWLSSSMSAQALAHHLGDALACLDINDSILMIRSYSPEVLPLLHAQTEEPWHQWLFGPVHNWWVINQQGWQHLAGIGVSDEVNEYHPIKLNQAMVNALQHDSLAVQLVEQVAQLAPEVFPSDCYGERLQHVTDLLKAARECELNTEDQSTFVLHSLLERRPLHQQRDWHRQINQVRTQGVSLENVLAEASER